ncbi:MAG TPA: hypothetical protein VK177_00895 [Flavobacteriales bacterium]|nr:hypothetical protein [Flavobacteriales bacterium]
MRLVIAIFILFTIYACGEDETTRYDMLEHSYANEPAAKIEVPTDTVTPPAKEELNDPKAVEALPDTCLLEGYFKEFTRTIWDAPTTCDCFVVKSGSKELIRYLNAFIESGNSVNFKDEPGNLVINVELDKLDAETVELITRSTPQKKIRLFVQAKELEPTCAEACFSFVNILDAIE